MDNVPVSVMEREFHFESGVKAEMIMWGVTTPDICWVITMGKKRRPHLAPAISSTIP